MRKYFDPFLRDIFALWVSRIPEVFPGSKYEGFTVADFMEEFKDSKDLNHFYPDLYLYLDHSSFLPTRKAVKEKQRNTWQLPLKSLMTAL